MHIFYDNIVFALQKFGGISTYWYELSKRFLKDSDINIHFFETGGESANIYRKKLTLNPQSITTVNRGGILLERFRRVPVSSLASNVIFHSSYFRLPKKSSKIKTACTVYDFIHDKYLSNARAFLHNIPKRNVILESDLIITISESTKNDLIRYYPSVDPGKVHTVYLGVSEVFKPVLVVPSQLQKPFILYIGVRDQYKNFNFAVDLVSHFAGYDLYIVGSPLTKNELHFVVSKLPDRFKVFTGLEASFLNELYNTAFCLIYPSSYEGFGIPILEAMNAGCPFIAVNTSSIPEVAGSAGVLLSKTDLEEGINAVKTIENNYLTIKNKGFEQAQKFSWDTCYQQTLNLYKGII